MYPIWHFLSSLAMMDIPSFQTTFAVPLTCDSCIASVSTSIRQLKDITEVTGDLSAQLISVRGSAAPSAIVAAIQATGRDAILRGSGASDSAAVCILETHAVMSIADAVRGLVRMVQVAPSRTIFDLGIRGLAPGEYQATIRERGDISAGPESTGPIWGAETARREGSVARGALGMVKVGESGVGSVFQDRPVEVWEMIGRSIVVSKEQRKETEEVNGFSRGDLNTVVGVIARSAGVWDNDKTVCSCSGQTVWEERKEQVGRGML